MSDLFGDEAPVKRRVKRASGARVFGKPMRANFAHRLPFFLERSEIDKRKELVRWLYGSVFERDYFDKDGRARRFSPDGCVPPGAPVGDPPAPDPKSFVFRTDDDA